MVGLVAIERGGGGNRAGEGRVGRDVGHAPPSMNTARLSRRAANAPRRP
jgi:hypothetical protein